MGSEQERRNWMTRIQEQINYSTDVMRHKVLQTGGPLQKLENAPSTPGGNGPVMYGRLPLLLFTSSLHRAREPTDEDDDDDADDVGSAGALAKNREMQKEYFQVRAAATRLFVAHHQRSGCSCSNRSRRSS